jgi:hypothetical protein
MKRHIRRRIAYCAALLLLGCACVKVSLGEFLSPLHIVGHVSDAATGRPLEGVAVSFEDFSAGLEPRHTARWITVGCSDEKGQLNLRYDYMWNATMRGDKWVVAPGTMRESGAYAIELSISGFITQRCKLKAQSGDGNEEILDLGDIQLERCRE